MFYGRDREQYGFMSNFYHAPFQLNGITYPDVEHYYVSMNKNFKDAVMNAETPGRAKRLGDDSHKKSFFVQGLSKKKRDWEQIKFNVMEEGVFAKFTQHPDLMSALKASSPAILSLGGVKPLQSKGLFAL